MSFYHRLFFPQCAFQQLEEIDHLMPFMYLQNIPLHHINILKENIKDLSDSQVEEKVVKTPEILQEKDVIKETNVTSIQNIFHPKKTDSLFWCIYIAIYGYDAYTNIGHRYGNIEMEEKQKMINLMQRSPTDAKNCSKRITKALYQEILSEFMTNIKMTRNMLIMYSIYHNKRFFIVRQDKNGKNLFYMNISKMGDYLDDASTIILYHSGRNDYSIDLSGNQPQLDNLFCFDNFDLPLKAISNYKTNDLIQFAEKLGLYSANDNKPKKPELYEKILQYILL